MMERRGSDADISDEIGQRLIIQYSSIPEFHISGSFRAGWEHVKFEGVKD